MKRHLTRSYQDTSYWNSIRYIDTSGCDFLSRAPNRFQDLHLKSKKYASYDGFLLLNYVTGHFSYLFIYLDWGNFDGFLVLNFVNLSIIKAI